MSAAVRDALFAACPEPDILVNNNGGPPPRDFETITREEVLAAIEGSMLTPIALARTVLPGMAKRGFGRIIQITSAGVRSPIARLEASAAARAGLTAFFAGAARKYARHNVTINTIQPGMFDTDRIKRHACGVRRSGSGEGRAGGGDPGAADRRRRRNSASSARSSPAPMPATSSARTCSSTAARSPALSEI